MRIALLGSTESWYYHDLRRAAAGHELLAVSFREITSSLTAAGVGAVSGSLDLASADAILVRTMPPGSLEQVVFRMDVLGRLAARGTAIINSPRAIETAVDKYLSTALLAAADLPVPPTITCQTATEAMAAFEVLGCDVVCKPLFGSEGRGLFRLTDPDAAFRAVRMLEQQQAVIYLQQFIDHPGFDVRVLIVGERAFGMRRENPSDWRTNASRGAKCTPYELSDEIRDMARRAARAVSAEIAGVDLLPDGQGRWHVLEVNAVPGWRALSQALNVDIAREVVDYIASSDRVA